MDENFDWTNAETQVLLLLVGLRVLCGRPPPAGLIVLLLCRHMSSLARQCWQTMRSQLHLRHLQKVSP
jgi:hypothetical protein